MITNFEKITEKLTDDEKPMIRSLMKVLEKHRKSNPILAPALVIQVMAETGKSLTQPRLRKMVNLLRTKGVLPVIATSKGYYLSYDQVEVASQVVSQYERAEAIIAAAQGLKRFTTHALITECRRNSNNRK